MNIAMCIGAFALVFWSVIYVLLHGITMDRYLLTLSYFAVLSMATVALFLPLFRSVIHGTSWRFVVGIIIASLLVHAVTCYICLYYLGEPTAHFPLQEISFLQLSNYFIWVKPLEVLWQQIMLVLLFTVLAKNRLTLWQIMLLTAVFFGVAHVYQAWRAGVQMGVFFTAGALVFSVLFPYLILKVQNGYAYAYAVHLCIYSAAALLVRVV